MNRRTKLCALMTLQVLLGVLLAAASYAADPDDTQEAEPDGDWPYTAKVTFQKTVDGNPLSQGDEVYNLTGSYRSFEGDLGVEASIAYAEPRDGADELQMVDFSVVWYANYKQQNGIFAKGWPIKPEFVLSVGPGLAWLERGGDPVEAFLTVNGAIGANLYWFQGEHRTTSHWFLRPEFWGRWFTGDGGELDWGWGVGLGYGFGKRLTQGALELRVKTVCGKIEGYDRPLDVAKTFRRGLGDLKDQITRCGAERCANLHEIMAGCVSQFDRILYQLEAGAAAG